jgi:transposase
VAYIKGENREAIVLFPECINDYITEENPVRIIDAFVLSLDVGELGFEKAVPAATGRPPFNPKDLLKLYLYGYMNRIRSSRRLEEESGRNLELMWLLNKLKPDFKTIADFRKNNKTALKNVFRQFSMLCKKWDLFSKEVVAVDGSKFRACNSKRNNFSNKKLNRHIQYIDEKIEEYIKEIENNDEQESNQRRPDAEEIKKRINELKERKQLYEGYQKALKETDANELSTTDPDARLMAVNNNGIDVCYNVQTVVDSKNKLIMDCEVINNPTDQGQLSNMCKKAKEILGVETIQALADKGYYSTQDLKECEKEQIVTYVAKQTFSNSTGDRDFYSDKFRYAKEENVYTCPTGQKLYPSRIREVQNGKVQDYKNFRACKNCELRDRCTKSQKGRLIARNLEQDLLDQVDERTKSHKDLYKQRQMIVEHPFGTIKRNFGHTCFLTKGLESVGTEASLSFLAYNLKRVINILGIQELRNRLAAVQPV